MKNLSNTYNNDSMQMLQIKHRYSHTKLNLRKLMTDHIKYSINKILFFKANLYLVLTDAFEGMWHTLVYQCDRSLKGQSSFRAPWGTDCGLPHHSSSSSAQAHFPDSLTGVTPKSTSLVNQLYTSPAESLFPRKPDQRKETKRDVKTTGLNDRCSLTLCPFIQ